MLLNSSLEEGKGPACPNSNITFLCIAREVSSLRWMIGDTIITTIAYLSNENYTKVTDIYYIEAKLIKRGCVAPDRTVCIINSTLTLRKDLSSNIMDTEIICEARTASLQVIRSLLTITSTLKHKYDCIIVHIQQQVHMHMHTLMHSHIFVAVSVCVCTCSWT